MLHLTFNRIVLFLNLKWQTPFKTSVDDTELRVETLLLSNLNDLDHQIITGDNATQNITKFNNNDKRKQKN